MNRNKLLILILTIVIISLIILTPGNKNRDIDKSSRQYRALEIEGYEEIKLSGNPLGLGCSDSDSIFTSKRFTAIKNEKEVEGAVCCGLISGFNKGCSIRTE